MMDTLLSHDSAEEGLVVAIVTCSLYIERGVALPVVPPPLSCVSSVLPGSVAAVLHSCFLERPALSVYSESKNTHAFNL